MIIIPGKVSANRVLNCLSPRIKFTLRLMTKFVGENEKFSATGSRCRHNLVWQTVMYLARSTVVDSSFNNLVRYMNRFVVNDL